MKFFLKLALLMASLAMLLFILLDKYNMGVFLAQIGEVPTINKQEEYILELREGMLSREKEVTLTFKGNRQEVNTFVSKAIDEVFQIDDPSSSSDFDYLRYCSN